MDTEPYKDSHMTEKQTILVSSFNKGNSRTQRQTKSLPTQGQLKKASRDV